MAQCAGVSSGGSVVQCVGVSSGGCAVQCAVVSSGGSVVPPESYQAPLPAAGLPQLHVDMAVGLCMKLPVGPLCSQVSVGTGLCSQLVLVGPAWCTL